MNRIVVYTAIVAVGAGVGTIAAAGHTPPSSDADTPAAVTVDWMPSATGSATGSAVGAVAGQTSTTDAQTSSASATSWPAINVAADSSSPTDPAAAVTVALIDADTPGIGPGALATTIPPPADTDPAIAGDGGDDTGNVVQDPSSPGGPRQRAVDVAARFAAAALADRYDTTPADRQANLDRYGVDPAITARFPAMNADDRAAASVSNPTITAIDAVATASGWDVTVTATVTTYSVASTRTADATVTVSIDDVGMITDAYPRP